MKISISLPADDVAVLDEFARASGLPSRSAAVHHAVRMLRMSDLEQDYATAWSEWEASGDHAAWNVTVSDGMPDAPR